MDDALERPDAQLPTPEGISQEDGDQGSDDEGDVVLDWTKLLPSSARPVIPRRGEKEFEPQPGGGSGLQVHVLDRARNAMFEALRATRTISSKSVSYAIWYPELSRAHVTVARGTLFTSIGHSAPRRVDTEDGSEKLEKRMEILPEETLYLIERGSLFCWKATDLDLSGAEGLEEVLGSPMTVQQAFSEMIGTQDLTLEKYQVYAYLKRLGYVVTRTTPPDSHYPVPPPFDLSPLNRKTSSVLSRIFSVFRYRFWQFFGGGRFDWWKPFRMSRWLLKDKNYGSIFRSLRFIPSGHGVPLLPIKSEPAANPSPYHLFFNVHKPGTSYRKTLPALPDYQIVVINARTTPMPTLSELTDLFDISPELPPPLPRQRQPLKGGHSSTAAPSKPVPPLSLSLRVLHWFRPPPPQSTAPARRPHPFMAIKAGKKTVVVAVVDAGNTSFFRFGQGAFSEWALF
ncbi:tRNA-splicing endonuclease subunit sen54 N-term-domain-containing protein [Roridomyces roridus]|uniref:tRNA-splicing endonuclease subunit sen54 N-term-domain-containing protein n=1 Tax=Roridomyces roridus TaxID=1738132 RepID=A0AAD7CES8_9AGAR|nr:tRNA-splicing endonuclease subunit sen54 N-term-domain-containing protein [Roridomyces roridus]